MPQIHRPFIDTINSVCTLFRFSPEEYGKILDIELSVLIDGGREIIRRHKDALHTADERCLLDQLVNGLLEEAPTPKGQRHVAAVLHIVQRDGEEGVVKAAKVWLERLVFPMLGLPRTEPVWSPTPPIIDEDLRDKLAIRERCCCAISKYLDTDYVAERAATGKGPVPDERPQILIEPAYIIPFAMSPFSVKDPKDQQEMDVILNWNLLLAWTGIDISGILEGNINSPANGIFLRSTESRLFCFADVIFDKEPARVINNYGTFSDGRTSAEVEFLEGRIEVPNPLLLAIRASLGKAIYWNGSRGALRLEAYGPGWEDISLADVELPPWPPCRASLV